MKPTRKPGTTKSDRPEKLEYASSYLNNPGGIAEPQSKPHPKRKPGKRLLASDIRECARLLREACGK